MTLPNRDDEVKAAMAILDDYATMDTGLSGHREASVYAREILRLRSERDALASGKVRPYYDSNGQIVHWYGTMPDGGRFDYAPSAEVGLKLHLVSPTSTPEK